ncbi:MAG: enoyl-CoA hydratase-related protein, partial [Blastomonas fulva]|uniref:enoyl-CoA hydratase-related protein n=1 Tax=Blastomonas fulva TaxID=1550728 RepID=UPI004034A395
FEQAGDFAVHILASDQDHLANLFASRVDDKFAGMDILGDGPPRIDGCSARLVCTTRHLYEGGDHVIMVGEVIDYESEGKPPLLFHSGGYADRIAREARSGPPPVLYTVKDRIATITLNRPDTRNALAEEVIGALVSALEAADADPEIDCVILTGEGPSFCSGGNIKQIKALTSEQHMSPMELENWYKTQIQRIPLTMDRMSVPVIAAVRGHAIGAGCDLACMADIRIAAEDAVFAESFLRVGIIPGDGGAWLLPRIIGLAKASQMMLTGEFIDAHKAERYGLVSEVVPVFALAERAMAMARMVAQFPPSAIRKTKRLIKDARDVSLAEHLDQAAIWQGVLQQIDDHREAIDAILEKRAPRFQGK